MESRVNDPPHYTQGPIHCIDAMISAFGIDAVVTFCLLNAFKYTWRSTTHTSGPNENIQKAMWYRGCPRVGRPLKSRFMILGARDIF